MIHIKADGMWGVGLYGGVVRDLDDPSKKTISGEGFNLIIVFVLLLPYCVDCLRRALTTALIVRRSAACV